MMQTKNILPGGFITILMLWGLSIFGQVSDNTTNYSSISASLNWKTYSNSKFGFTFQYPDSWIKPYKEVEIQNISGAISTVEIYFIDSTERTVLLITYHLAPNGADLFKYNLSQYQSKKGYYSNHAGSKISFAGIEAIQATDTLWKDGKGELIQPPLKSVIVDFLDKEQTGTFELQFKTPLKTALKEDSRFTYLLSTFSFLK